MEEVKIRSGTRIRLKPVDESEFPDEFLTKVRELAHRNESVQALYLFEIVTDSGVQRSMAVGVKTSLFKKAAEEFLRIVDEIQMILPPELPLNLYRLAATPVVARFCLDELEPIYLRSAAWKKKLQKKIGKE